MDEKAIAANLHSLIRDGRHNSTECLKIIQRFKDNRNWDYILNEYNVSDSWKHMSLVILSAQREVYDVCRAFVSLKVRINSIF